MSERKVPSEEETRRFWSAFAEDVVSTPNNEFAALLREESEDPNALAFEVRQVLRATVKRVRQEPLRDAKERHAAALKRLLGQPVTLPADMLRKRAILAEVFARRPDLLTAQFRDLENVPDSDVDGMLRQLAALDILEKIDEK